VGAFKIRRLGYALGAEITGLDFRTPVNEEAIAEIRQVWLDYVVLCFPGFDWQPQEMAAFCRRFGPLDDNRRNPRARHPGRDDVLVFTNTPVAGGKVPLYSNRADQWHSDRSFSDRPATGTFLFAKELPDAGGDTMFANMYMAYETLSPALQRLIEPLEAIYDFTLSPSFPTLSPEVQDEWRRLNPPMVHPVVRTHSETGRKALCLDARLIRSFLGMKGDETKPILNTLYCHATRYEFTYRHRWSARDLVLWDNRCAMHYAVPDFNPRQLRQMERVSLLAPKSGYLASVS
jgi:taurine dioxygenase